MNILFKGATTVAGTPFTDIHYELRDGSVLRASGFVSVRQEWFKAKHMADFTEDDFILVLKEYFIQWFQFDFNSDDLIKITGR